MRSLKSSIRSLIGGRSHQHAVAAGFADGLHNQFRQMIEHVG